MSPRFFRVMVGVGEAKPISAISLQRLYMYVVRVVVPRMTVLLFVYKLSCRVSSVTHPYGAIC